MNNVAPIRSSLPVLKVGKFSNFSVAILLIIAFLLVIPILDVPMLGLSLTAPLIFLVAVEALIRPPHPWSIIGLRYIILAVIVGAGIFTSLAVNGLSSGGTDIAYKGISTVIHYFFWLFAFVLTIYVISAGNLAQTISRVLGWSVLLLAILRWGEVLVYGNIGAESITHLQTQNDYGFLFSTFSPFLLAMIFSEKKVDRFIAVPGSILLWGAAAVNGSRGSWVAIGVGIVFLLVLLLFSQPRKAVGTLFFITIMAGSAYLAFSAFPRISQVVENRLITFQNLNEDKDYQIRLLEDQKAQRLFESSLWFGVGPGRFQVSIVQLDIPQLLQYAAQSHFDVKSSHNSYLGFLAEDGLVGAMPLGILLILLAVFGFFAAISLSRQKKYWGIAVYSGFVGMSVHMWSIASLTNTANWFIYGLVAAMIILARTESKGTK